MIALRAPAVALAALAVLAWAAPLGAQQTRTKEPPPAAAPPRPVEFPAFHERTLSNGAQVIVVQNDEQPVVSISLRIKSGSVSDPAGRAGVALLTAALLDKGTKTRSAREIAESIGFVGASLTATSSDDWTSLGTTVLTEFVDSALVLLSDVALEPIFPAEELETERQRALSSLQVSLANPQQLAARRFFQEVYGTHPYGAAPSAETLGAIRREDLAAFHAAHFRPGNALFVVAGDVRPEEMVARLEHHFGAWQGGAAARPALAAPPARDQREIVLVHRPGAVQAVLRIGHLLPPATHPDWTALDVANQVLGGGTAGWFFRVLRGEKGYTYGAYTAAAKRLEPGYFQALAEVRNEVADSALADALRLIEELRDRPVPADDLRKARDFMTGSFPLMIETPQQVAAQVARNRLLGLPVDQLGHYRDQVAAVSAADVQRVARAHIHPDRAIIVVVGDADQLRERLRPFGALRVVDAEGRPLGPAAPAAAGARSVPE